MYFFRFQTILKYFCCWHFSASKGQLEEEDWTLDLTGLTEYLKQKKN